MKKTATLIAIAGLSMAAKTEHSFLGKKPVEIKAEIDPKMVIKPAHDIDPGMVRKPHRNIDQGMIVKPKKTQGAILTADDNDDELLTIYRPPHDIDPFMVINPRDDIDQGIFVKPKKPTTILTADDNDDELLLIYRPADNLDPGMVRKPPVGYDIDPKFVIKPPRGFDDGIFVRPRPRTEPVWVDDEMMLTDPGFIIKPKRGDIDPGMIRKPVKGREIDPNFFVKPRRGDVVYVDDEELMVRRPPFENMDQGIIRKPRENIKYLDAENDDELALVGNVREPRDRKLIGDFPVGPWPGKPVYADAQDDEFCFAPTNIGTVSVSDPIIHAPKHDKHDDESEQMSAMVREPRYVAEHGKSADDADDELAFILEKPKQVREPRLIGDFYTKPWPGQPVYADAEDNELLQVTGISDQGIPIKHDDELYYGGGIRGFQAAANDDEFITYVSDQGVPGGKQHDDEELYYGGGIRGFETARAVNDLAFSARPMSLKRDDDYELALRLIRVQTQHHDDDEMEMAAMVREPRYVGEHGKSADDELVYALSRIDPGMVRRPFHENIDQGMVRRPRTDMKFYNAENEDELFQKQTINDLNYISRIHHPKPPGKPIKGGDNANDDELIMFADSSLGKPRKGIFDPKELTKPWYQQQTMYADDADNELANFGRVGPKTIEKNKTKLGSKPVNKPVNEADDADNELGAWGQPKETMHADDADNELGAWGQPKETMHADDADNELGVVTKKRFESNPKAPMINKPVHKPVQPVQEADDADNEFARLGKHRLDSPYIAPRQEADDADNELIKIEHYRPSDHSLDARHRALANATKLTKSLDQQKLAKYDDDSLVLLAELLEDN